MPVVVMTAAGICVSHDSVCFDQIGMHHIDLRGVMSGMDVKLLLGENYPEWGRA
jgi:hypothetical protein